MKTNFKVRYVGGYYNIISDVYEIDTARDRFLIVDHTDGYFMWVDTESCKLYKEDSKEVMK